MEKDNDQREYKTFPSLGLKIVEDQGIVEHIITVFGVLDHVKDISHPGSFKKTLQERGSKVRVLDMHRADSIMRVVAKPLEIREVGRDELPKKVLDEYPDATGGVQAKTKFLLDTPEGKGAFIRLKEGAVDEWSYGYDALDYDNETVKKDGEDVEVRNLRQIRLYEYGPVLWGANPATTTLSAKTDGEPSESKPAPEVTENTIRIRVRNPGDFDPNAFGEGEQFRTITIGPKTQGIQAVIGRLKDETSTTVQSYIFDKEKWNVGRAQAWVDEHKKDAVPDLDEKQMDEDEAGDLVPTETALQCECIKCGYKADAPEGGHCSDMECPKCGGEMRRVGRPGPGKGGEEPEQAKMFGSVLNPYGTRSSAGYPGGRSAWKQAWRRMLSKGNIGTVQGTIRRASMIAAGMKPPCNIPQGQSYEDVQPRSGACGGLEGSWNHTPGDYGLSRWKDPSDDDLTREDIQLTCQDLKDIKLMCLQEIKKRHECEDEGKGNCDCQLEIKDLDGEWLWEIGMAFGIDNVIPPWTESPKSETKEVPEAVVFASVALQSVLTKLDQESLEYKAAELAVGKLRGLYGELAPDLVAELETKAGRVLAARNAQRIGAALASLIEVLKDAGIDVPGVGREMPADEEAEEEEKDYGLEIEALETELGLLEMEGDTRVW